MMTGAVGNDGFAAAALELLTRDGVELALVRRVDRPTGCAAIMVGAQGENLIAVASGANRAVVAASVPDSALDRATQSCNVRGETPNSAATVANEPWPAS